MPPRSKPNPRSKKVPTSVPVSIPEPSQSPPVTRNKSRPFAPPTTNADKDRLLGEYSTLFDKLENYKNDLTAADSLEAVRRAGPPFDEILVRNGL
jgi:hypothetical protein